MNYYRLIRNILMALAIMPATLSWAAIAHVVSTSAGSAGNSGSTITTSGINTTGANLIVVAVSYYNVTDPGLTDSKGNTWTALTAREGGSSHFSAKLFYCVSPNVGTGHTFTAAQSTSYPTISVSAFSGVAASPFDQESGAATSSTDTSYQPGSLTPSENNCLLVTGVTTDGTSHSIDGSFNATSTNQSTSNHMGGGIAYKIQTTAGAENPTWSWTGTSKRAAAIAVFKSAASTPVITTSATQSLEESERLVCELTATDGTEPYAWTVTGGADAALFSVVDVSGDPWLQLDGSADFENPDDADSNGVYVVEVTCTDDDTATDALTISVTITDEGGGGGVVDPLGGGPIP